MEKVNNFLNHVLPKILSVILVFLIFTSMIDSNLIQGCARVVNYTASIRGGSQRIVKLVIMGQPYSDLINESEIILNELKNGGKVHNLVPPAKRTIPEGLGHHDAILVHAEAGAG